MGVVEESAQGCHVNASQLDLVPERLDEGAHVGSFHQDAMHVDAL